MGGYLVMSVVILNAIYDEIRDRWYNMGPVVLFDRWDHLLLSAAEMYESYFRSVLNRRLVQL